MKYLAALPFAAVLALGLGTAAHALPADADLRAMEASVGAEYDHVDHAGNPYHRCHGASSGTAHVTCGSMTGGPSGSLF